MIPRKTARRSFLGGSLVLLAGLVLGSSWVLAQEESPAAPSDGAWTLFLVRHAEKAKDDPRDPGLTAAGRERAVELARMLGEAQVSHLFTTDYRRTRSTVGPLAAARGLEVEVYDPRQPEDLLSSLRELPPGAVAVVAGHSNTTPKLYLDLTGENGRDLEQHPRYGGMIPDDDYDRLYCVTLERRAEEVRLAASFELRYGAD